MVATIGNLNINQVFNLLLRNGANAKEAATLAGISVWEAGGGNPNSINPLALNDNANTQDYSVGLFQYNFRAGNFNIGNPMASTRGGFTPGDLLGNLDVQAKSALALLRGSASGYGNWTTYNAHFSSIQGFVNQLLNGGITSPTDTTVPSDTGVTDTTGTQTTATTGTQTTATVGSNPSQSTSTNLNLADSIQHTIIQFLLVLVGLALLLGGIYLLGSKR
jgi:hypothetical protein